MPLNLAAQKPPREPRLSVPLTGIKIVTRIESNPNNRVYAAYVSLCESHVHVTARTPPTGLRTPGGWGDELGVQLATNGDFYKTDPVRVYGDAVGDGIPWPLAATGKSAEGEWYYKDYGWIAFGDSWVEFNHTKQTKTEDAEEFGVQFGWHPTEVTEAIPEGTQSLVSGFPELVIEGQAYQCSSATADDCFPDRSDMRARHPRTAMGLTEDRGTFILVAVDGRDGTVKGTDRRGSRGGFCAAKLRGISRSSSLRASMPLWARDAGVLRADGVDGALKEAASA